MQYKGFLGKFEFDRESGCFVGEVVDTRDPVTFQGMTQTGLKIAFEAAVDDYLFICWERGDSPEKLPTPFKKRTENR